MTHITDDYEQQIRQFAEFSAAIYRMDPATHYRTEIRRAAKRPMEPGFIPIDKPAKIMTVSFFPNASEMRRLEFEASCRSIAAWGKSGSVADYEAAYKDWLSTLPYVPFYRDFNKPIFEELGIEITEFGWLPLIKLPLPARTKVSEDDIWVDRMLLWDQLLPLKPKVVLAQGVEVYRVVSAMCEDKFPHRVVCQKIDRVGTNAYHVGNDERVVRELRQAMQQL